ncbi:MAG: precorrin-6Y C5,15-methyltransferase (decarboxylating) subunit CbiT [Lachnospiraceae bacterium]|nr:precorrin-6Y C5,15-methyltransferase (decarboxylating) subunit CbiT [Lachnospiraceae bacterium]
MDYRRYSEYTSIPDSEFIRGKVPMTKEEVRTVTISKLHLGSNKVFWDIGSGTGSVSVQAAIMYPGLRICAIEHDPEGIELIKKNMDKFATDGIEVIEGDAPDCFAHISGRAPDAAFIGGSGGKLEQIIEKLYELNDHMRIAVNAVTTETVIAINNIMKQYPIKDRDVIQMYVSREREIGNLHLMEAQNPVYIAVFDLNGDR